MKIIILLGLVTFAALFSSSDAGCDECTKCWNYKRCEITTFPWNTRRYYSVMISQVKMNNFWGAGDSCGVFNKCSKHACGCLGWDIYYVKGNYVEGSFFAYDRKNYRQYMRRFSAVMDGNNGWGDMAIFVHSGVIWTVPAVVYKRVVCDECGKVTIETYTVPAAAVETKLVSFKFRVIVIVLKVKFRIIVFCNGLKGIINNKPFALVLATMPKPSQKTWKRIREALRHYNFEPRDMAFLHHDRCIYPPFHWCKTLVVPKNTDCDICVYNK